MLWYDSDPQNFLGHMVQNHPCDPTQPQRGPEVRYYHMPRRCFLVKLFGGNHLWLSQWVSECECECVCVCVCVCLCVCELSLISSVTSSYLQRMPRFHEKSFENYLSQIPYL